MWNNNEILKARAIIDAQERQKALESYEAQKAQLDNKYNNGGLGGFLGGIIGGIGKGIGDIGNSVVDMLGSGVASARDLGSILTTGKSAGENEKWLMSRRGTDNAQDAYAKTAGQALNAATTLASTAVPMAGAGGVAAKALGGTVANTAAGAVGGLADELQQQGKDANLESAANRAISGAAAGLVTGGLNKKIGNATGNISSKLLNNKLATSAVGRGALSGAVGGATGAGTSAALSGGDIGQAALQGGLSGAAAGGIQGGLVSGANALKKTIVDKNRVQQPVNVVDDGMPDYTTPKDWNNQELVLEKKGVIGALGDKLKNVSKGIKDQDVYNSLYSKTAEKVNRNNSIERLRELGFEPKDYGNAAKVSTAVNKFFNDVVANSGATITDTDLATRLYNPEVTFQTDNLQKAYNTKINNLMSKLEKGAMPGNYSAKDLLDASREFSGYAATEYRKGIDVNGSDIGNGRSDVGDAYMRVSRDLRSLADQAMDGLGDNYTRSQLTKMLENMNAPKKTIEYFGNFTDLADGIRKTATLEDARQINSEISKTKIRRNASAGNTRNVVNRVLDKTGAGQLLDTVAEPIGRVTGTVAEKVGTGLQKLDSAIQNVEPVSQNIQAPLGNLIGRTAGQQGASNNVQSARKAQDYQTLENMFGGLAGGSQGLTGAQSATNMMGAYPTAQTSQIEAQLADITNGMRLAMAAGDYTAYNQLADLYKTAYNTYQMQAKLADTGTSNAKLSKTQQQANAAALALNELENMNPDYGYKVKDIPLLNLVNVAGNKYSSTADSLAMQIGYMLSGANIKEEEARKIGSAYVPQPFDDDATRRYKLQQARQIIQQYQNTYTTDDNNNNNQLAMAY